jgi:hypothetical protein
MTSRLPPSRRSYVSRLFLSGHLRSPNSDEVDSLIYWLGLSVGPIRLVLHRASGLIGRRA